MKKYICLFGFLFIYSFSGALEQIAPPQGEERLSPLEEQVHREKCKSKTTDVFLISDGCLNLKSPEARRSDLQFSINTELGNRNKANGFNYAALVPPKTEEEIARERIITFLIWFGGGLAFMCICFVVFRLVKNRIALRIKQRAGKHTLDDVCAAGKGK